MTSPSRTRSNTSRHHQRGAIGLLGVVTLLLAVLFTALAVDAGRLWMQRRQLQLVADIASIQAARQMGCGSSLSNVQDAAQAAAVANGYTGNLKSTPNIVDIVDVSTNGGIREFTANGSEAVRVYATQQVPASLVAGGIFGGTVTLHAQAVSRADPAIAAFTAGSYAARIDTQNSVLLNALLGDTLGSSVNLDVVSYKGIANTNVTLNDLLQASGQVGGLDSLLNTNMSLADMIDLYAQAVSNSGTASASVQAAMQQLASAAVDSTTLTLGDVIDVSTPDPEAAGKAGINLFSLIMTSALIANGNHAIDLPLAVSVPGIASINGHVTVISPPQLAIGPAGSGASSCTSVKTAQVEASVDVNTTVNAVLANVDINLRLETTVAPGTASLSDVTVGDSATTVDILAQPGIATVKLSNIAETKGATLSATLPVLGHVDIAQLTMNLPVTSSTQTVTFTVDHPVADNLPQTQSVSSSVGDTLANALNPAPITVTTLINNPLVNGTVNTLLSKVVTPVIQPLLKQIASVFIDPLLETLGIQAGGMDITLDGLQAHQEKPLII